MKISTLSLSLLLLGCQSGNQMSTEDPNSHQKITVSVQSATATPEASVEIRGPGGEVKVDTGGVQINGADGGKVSVESNGTVNIEGAGVVSNGAGGKGKTITGAASQQTLTLDHEPVSVAGASHQITLKGTVTHLEVAGANNQVTVEQAESVSISGTNNQVHYSGKKPDISISGLNNQCEPK